MIKEMEEVSGAEDMNCILGLEKRNVDLKNDFPTQLWKKSMH